MRLHLNGKTSMPLTAADKTRAGACGLRADERARAMRFFLAFTAVAQMPPIAKDKEPSPADDRIVLGKDAGTPSSVI